MFYFADERNTPYPGGGTAPGEEDGGLKDTYDPENIHESVPEQARGGLEKEMEGEDFAAEPEDLNEPEDQDAKEGKITSRTGEDEEMGIDEDLNISK